MKAAALEEISLQGFGRRRDLPFGLGRKPRAYPLRIGIGFVIADMANRFVRPNATPSGRGVAPPLAVTLLPIERSIPAIRGELVPTIGEPQLGVLVSAGFYELEIFAIRHAARSKLERLQINFVARLFIVESKPASRYVTNLVNAFIPRFPRERNPFTRFIV